MRAPAQELDVEPIRLVEFVDAAESDEFVVGQFLPFENEGWEQGMVGIRHGVFPWGTD